jgi:hypothetical protein
LFSQSNICFIKREHAGHNADCHRRWKRRRRTSGVNTATATWEGYASPSEVKAGDKVKVTYRGTAGGLKKALKVAKQGAAEVKPIKKVPKKADQE